MISQLEIRTFLNGDTHRAVHTTRYSRCAVHRVESVAEHVFNTMTYASVLALHLIEDGYMVDQGVVLNKALWHDTEEPAGTGDILRSVKHSNPDILNFFERLGRSQVARVSGVLGLSNWRGYDASCEPQDVILKCWLSAKDDSTEGQIVRVADALSVVAYLVEEYELGNHTMRDVHDEVVEYLHRVQEKILIPELKKFIYKVRSYLMVCVEYVIP